MNSFNIVNVWSRCQHCGMNPISGESFRCQTCPLGPDVDLCSACYEGYRAGRVRHPDPDAVVTVPGPHHFERVEGASAEQFATWLSIPEAVAPSPRVDAGFLVRPEFRSKRQSVFGGYGFVVQFEGHFLLLTALHVMDELIKCKGIDASARNSRYTGKELSAVVDSVRLYDVLKERWPLHELGAARPMLVLANARTGDPEPYSFRDIAAFHIGSRGALSPHSLAAEDPAPGDPVWLAAAVPNSSRTARATCIERTARSFIFRYEASEEIPKHSSGAPILDPHGAVVGINTGLGQFAGKTVGHANPVSSIRAHLPGALEL